MPEQREVAEGCYIPEAPSDIRMFQRIPTATPTLGPVGPVGPDISSLSAPLKRSRSSAVFIHSVKASLRLNKLIHKLKKNKHIHRLPSLHIVNWTLLGPELGVNLMPGTRVSREDDHEHPGNLGNAPAPEPGRERVSSKIKAQ